MMAAEPEVLANEGWINNRWRPAMAWQYFTVCLCDFIVFPAINSTMVPYHEWHPMTLQGGGLYHLAMGAIIGVSAWQRTQEKIAAYTAGGIGGIGSVTTERTMERTSSVAAPVTAPPAATAPPSPRAD